MLGPRGLKAPSTSDGKPHTADAETLIGPWHSSLTAKQMIPVPFSYHCNSAETNELHTRPASPRIAGCITPALPLHSTNLRGVNPAMLRLRLKPRPLVHNIHASFTTASRVDGIVWNSPGGTIHASSRMPPPFPLLELPVCTPLIARTVSHTRQPSDPGFSFWVYHNKIFRPLRCHAPGSSR